MQESTALASAEELSTPLAVEMRSITKAWPGVVANDHVNLKVHKGEIHAGWREWRWQNHLDEYPVWADSPR